MNGHRQRAPKVRRPREALDPYVGWFLSQLADRNPGLQVEAVVCGSYRRQAPTVGDLDIVVVSDDGVFAEGPGRPGVRLPGWVDWDRYGPKVANGSMTLPDGPLLVDVWACTPEQRAPFLAFATGPAELNISQRAAAKRRGLALSQLGLYDRETGERRDDGTEEGIYAALGWEWLAPAERQRWAR